MTPFIGSDIFDFINQVSFFVKRQAKNICQASLFGRPKWPLGIFVKTHGDIQVLPKSTFIWTVIDLRLYEYQFESSSNISKYILTFLFVKYWNTGRDYLINQSTTTPFVIHYNDMRLSNYDHLKFEHLTKYQVRYETFDRSWDRWLMHLPNHLEKYVTWPWLT